MPDRFNIGDEVKVSFNIKGSKWMKDGKENYFTNLDAWRIEQVLSSQQTAAPQPAVSSVATYDENADDLPF